MYGGSHIGPSIGGYGAPYPAPSYGAPYPSTTGYALGSACPPSTSPYPASGYYAPPPPMAAMHSGMPAPPPIGVIGPMGGVPPRPTSYAAPPVIGPRESVRASTPVGSATPITPAMGYGGYSATVLPSAGVSASTGYVSTYNPSDYFTKPVKNIINGVDVSEGNRSIQPGAIYCGSNTAAPPAMPTPSAMPVSSAMPASPYPYTVPGPYVSAPRGPAPSSMAQSILASRETAAPSASATPATPAAPSRKKPEKKEFYEVEFENGLVKRLAENEILEPVLQVYKTDYFPGVPTLAVVSNRRLLLITEDRRGGVYWPLKTTEMTRCEEGNLVRNGKFFFKSSVAGSKEHVLEFKDRKSASLLATLFEANRAYAEYNFVAIKNRGNVFAVFREECDIVTRFSGALGVCSSNPEAMFDFLLSMDAVLPLVRRQLRAAANEWAKSNMGTTSVEDFEMLDVIRPDRDEAAYYGQLASQIASFLMKGSYMRTYSGAIPLLDAYYFYGKATASDLKSPEEFLRACELLTKEKTSVNHCYLGKIKGKQMICAESLSAEKGEETVLKIIEEGNGRVSRNSLIRKMALPIGVCDDLIGKAERKGVIVRDNDNSDVYYYKNAFALVKTRVISDSKYPVWNKQSNPPSSQVQWAPSEQRAQSFRGRCPCRYQPREEGHRESTAARSFGAGSSLPAATTHASRP